MRLLMIRHAACSPFPDLVNVLMHFNYDDNYNEHINGNNNIFLVAYDNVQNGGDNKEIKTFFDDNNNTCGEGGTENANIILVDYDDTDDEGEN